MRCPHCTCCPSTVSKTTRPLDEGLDEGDVKQRLRKCRNCSLSFTTYEIHEDKFRTLSGVPSKRELKAEATPILSRKPLLAEDRKPTRSKLVEQVKEKLKKRRS